MQGDPDRQTTYSEDPSLTARRWLEQGASWLHVINLDGAFGESDLVNLQALAGILKTAGPFGARVEFGGGLRDQTGILEALELGVERVFLGTVAIRDPALLQWALAAYGSERIAGDIGEREGKVVIQGWQEATPLTVLEAGERFRRLGLEWCVLTDVSRDGVSSGVNLTRAIELQSGTGLNVVASGGASTLEDIQAAREAGLAGIILGRALYDGRLSLPDCLTKS